MGSTCTHLVNQPPFRKNGTKLSCCLAKLIVHTQVTDWMDFWLFWRLSRKYVPILKTADNTFSEYISKYRIYLANSPVSPFAPSIIPRSGMQFIRHSISLLFLLLFLRRERLINNRLIKFQNTRLTYFAVWDDGDFTIKNRSNYVDLAYIWNKSSRLKKKKLNSTMKEGFA